MMRQTGTSASSRILINNLTLRLSLGTQVHVAQTAFYPRIHRGGRRTQAKALHNAVRRREFCEEVNRHQECELGTR